VAGPSVQRTGAGGSGGTAPTRCQKVHGEHSDPLVCGMRTDWVPLSASALIVGAMSLMFGSVLNPSHAGASAVETLRVVDQQGARWIAMAVLYTFASVALTLGLPSVLTLFEGRGHRVGLVGVTLFTVGAIGTCGYAMLMVFFRAMVVARAVQGSQLDAVTHDRGLTLFLVGWVACFYSGALVLAVGLLVARTTPTWVPLLLLVFVAMLPVVSHLGRVGAAAQVLAFAVSFTGIAMAAVTTENRAALERQPAF
jgi:hypothetical protein